MSGVIKKILSTLLVCVALLAIAVIETDGQRISPAQTALRETQRVAKENLRARLESAVSPGKRSYGLDNMLRDSLAQDEFGDTLPFASLGNIEPITRLLAQGVKHFERTVYRSPDYHGEAGYDLVQYDIEQGNGRHSTLLAYLDRPLPNASHGVGEPDGRIPVVMVFEATGEKVNSTLYRAGDLVEQTEMSALDASDLVSARISLSIPFLSVSR